MTETVKVRELSEKDVLSVLDKSVLVRVPGPARPPPTPRAANVDDDAKGCRNDCLPSLPSLEGPILSKDA